MCGLWRPLNNTLFLAACRRLLCVRLVCPCVRVDSLIASVCTTEVVREIQRQAKSAGCVARVHIKIDTGMGRFFCRLFPVYAR